MDMKQQMNRLERYREELIVLGLLAAFGFFINRHIEVKGLYMDDLYLWSCYGEQSFMEYVFPVDSTRFRFIFYMISYVILGLIGTHITWIVPINIILNVLIAYTIFAFARRLSKNRWIGFLCAIAYLASRMSYYQIGQLYGLMESFALWAAIGILYLLYGYFNEDRKKNIIFASVLYFCLCFIHERYMVLLPLFVLVLLMRREKNKSLWAWCAGSFLLVMGIRLVAIGTLSPAGTAGTDVADTFQISQAIRFAFSQVAYVFGINDGPDHLSGLSFLASPGKIKLLVLAADLVLAVFVVIFASCIPGRAKGERIRIFQNAAIFVTFIALCIGSSSVTIRVEMRWVYVAFAGALLFLSYMAGVLESGGKAMLCAVLMTAYTLLLLPSEIFYRSQFSNLYLWPNQLRYNSLAEETYENYGDDIFGKTIYIIGDSYKMSDFTARTFFKIFDPKRKAEGLSVKFVESTADFGIVTEDMLVIAEDPEHNGFQDVTAFVRDQKLKPIEGYYSDHWMDQRAQMLVTAGNEGKIRFSCYYPDELTGDEKVTVTLEGVDGRKETREFLLSENLEFEIEARPRESVILTFENNFRAASATEQRGQEPMAMVVNISLY